MKVQFNLLPDVKQEYIGALRTKRTVLTVAMVVAGVSFVIFLFMAATVYGINKKQISDAGKDIDNYKNQINAVPDINKILTVQKQLGSLLTLHQSKHTASRIFTYLPQLTPTNVHIGRFTVDFTTNTLEISGATDTQKSANTFIDTLKFTTYKVNGVSSGKRAFPQVIESSFSLAEGKANYGLNVTFDPQLFSNSQKIELEVPSGLSTTRSLLTNPDALFNGENSQKTDQGGNQ